MKWLWFPVVCSLLLNIACMFLLYVVVSNEIVLNENLALVYQICGGIDG